MQALDSRKISVSFPENLLSNPLFWITYQKAFVGVLLIAVLVILSFSRYTYSGFNSYLSSLSNIFNLFIHSLGVWGVFVTAKAVATVEVERAIANEIKKKGEEGLRIKKKIDLSRLEATYLPRNMTEPALGMPRLFRHICKEAMNLKFESSIDVVEAYRDESLESLFAITNIQKIALRAGILGTFIGLLEAIMQLTKLESNSNPMDTIGTLSNALFISFSTSVAGLEVAILLGFLIMILRKCQADYFRDMESSVEVILILARNANNDDQSRVLGELAQVESAIAQLGKRFYDNTQTIQISVDAVLGSIDGVLDRVKDQTNEIQIGVQQLRGTKAEFDQFINEIGDVQYRFIGEVKGIYSELSLKSFRDDIKDGILFAGKTVANRLGKTEDSIKQQTEQINEGINTLLETRSKFGLFLQQIESSQEKFIGNVKESQDTVAMLKATADLKNTINQVIKRMEEITISMRALNQSLGTPISLVDRIKKTFLG